VVAGQHAAWGAAQAGEVGLSPLAINLIRRHEDKMELGESEEDTLLRILQAADDES
jgi:hypothetical protein